VCSVGKGLQENKISELSDGVSWLEIMTPLGDKIQQHLFFLNEHIAGSQSLTSICYRLISSPLLYFTFKEVSTSGHANCLADTPPGQNS
jgi:hypothetical protein